ELLEPPGARAGARLVFLLLLLVAPFAVIHDPANGRAGGGGDFDQVHARFAGHPQRLRGGDDADLLFLIVDQSDRRDPDLLVVAEIRRNGLSPKNLVSGRALARFRTCFTWGRRVPTVRPAASG